VIDTRPVRRGGIGQFLGLVDIEVKSGGHPGKLETVVLVVGGGGGRGEGEKEGEGGGGGGEGEGGEGEDRKGKGRDVGDCSWPGWPAGRTDGRIDG
jgi:hypothetical protein